MHGIDLEKKNKEKFPVDSDYPRFFGEHPAAKDVPV